MPTSNWGDIYEELGVKPIINAIGSVTLLGGATPSLAVQEAMDRAHSAYVPLEELEEKAGAAIARMLGVPAAYITSGAGSALTLMTAACIAGDDDAKIEQLPDTTGMPNEILIQKRQRYWYDRLLQFAGGKLVEFGDEDRTTEQQLAEAIGPKTAAVHYVADERRSDPASLSFEQVVKVATSSGVPVIVDSAGQVFPVENISKYVKGGAALSCIGAKYIGAPHSTGFVLGTEAMVRKVALQSFVSYEARRVRSIGRPHKVDRQEMVGVVAAVREWVTMNHEERLARYEMRSKTMAAPIRGIKGVTVTEITNTIGTQPFGVQVEVDPAVAGKTLDDVVRILKEGDPPVWTRVNNGSITLSVFGLNEGEEKIVGERIAAALR